MTAYRIGGPAKYYVNPSSRESLIQALRWAREENLPAFVMGAGTNILISDRGYPGLVIHLWGFLGDPGQPSPSGQWGVGAGVMLSPWVRRTAWQGYAGLEALIGIPGTVGGGLRMNAGAFSQEISGPLISVEVIGGDLDIGHLKAGEIGFAYRQAPGLEGKIIVSARFQLEPGDRQKLMSHVREVIALRRNRQPLEWPSCGSVFKRPEGDFAGRLIEAAGLKGMERGGAQISTKHANFIVNRGGATARDILNLIKTARKRVQEDFGVALEREVILVGFSEEELEGA
jgi:UDP-N-acetylmuramate dehydrogenase